VRRESEREREREREKEKESRKNNFTLEQKISGKMNGENYTREKI
jgi:hypothetical protein